MSAVIDRLKLSRVECLMTYIRGYCDQRRGSKAALAKYLGVRPHMISAWLAGTKPNAEHALGMVEWMQKQTQAAAAETKYSGTGHAIGS